VWPSLLILKSQTNMEQHWAHSNWFASGAWILLLTTFGKARAACFAESMVVWWISGCWKCLNKKKNLDRSTSHCHWPSNYSTFRLFHKCLYVLLYTGLCAGCGGRGRSVISKENKPVSAQELFSLQGGWGVWIEKETCKTRCHSDRRKHRAVGISLLLFYFLVGQGFGLRASCVQSRCFTAWATPPAPLISFSTYPKVCPSFPMGSWELLGFCPVVTTCILDKRKFNKWMEVNPDIESDVDNK
jgi:hypothetical protein